MITLIINESSYANAVPKVLFEASTSNTKVLGVTVAPSSILLYVQSSSDVVNRLHELIRSQDITKAIHSVDSLAMITVSGYELEEIPGVVDIVVSPLAKASINLYGALTISSSIKIFIPWSDRDKAVSLIEGNLNKVNNLGGNLNEFRQGEAAEKNL